MADSSSDSETEISAPEILEHLLFGNVSTRSQIPTSLVPTITPELALLQALRNSLQFLRDSLVDDVALLFPASSDAYKMFLPGGAESESVTLGKNLEKWNNIQHPEGQGKFLQSFVNEINKFLNDDFKRKCKKPKSVTLQQPTALPSENIVQLLSKFVTGDPSMLSLAKSVNDLLTSVFQEAHSLQSVAPQCGETTMHVSATDFSAVSDENLSQVICLFKPQELPLSREKMLEIMSFYEPKKQLDHKVDDLVSSFSLLHTGAAMQCTKCKVSLKRSSTCPQCSKPFCGQCLDRKGKILSQGSMKVMRLCSSCYDEIQTSEVQGWKEKSMELLATGKSEDIQSAIACLLMQLYASDFQENAEALSSVNKFAKQLVQDDLSDIAIPMLIAITQQSKVPIEKLRAHIFASKAFELLAYSPETLPNEQLSLLKAAVEECNAASKVKATGVEIPDLTSRITSLEKTIGIIEAEDEHQLNRAKQHAHSKLKEAWIKGNWDSIFLLIAERAGDHLKRPDGKNPTMEAIKEFVKAKAQESLGEKKLVLTFLQGMIDIFNQNTCEGLSCIEMAVWGSGGKISSHLFGTAIDVVIGALLQNSELVIPLQILHHCCKIVTKGENLDLCALLPALHLNEKDLLPPFKLQWSPSHHLSSRIKTFEDFAVQKFTKGEWTCVEVAQNYLDIIEKCHDTVEIVSCFINAALWLLKMLQQKSAEPCTSSNSEIYSFKKAVFHYMRQAFIITVSCLRTGMQFYVSRIAVAATVVASKYAGIQATPKDAAEINQFLYEFIHTARFCPFWKAPIVSVSEITILSEIIEKQHCLFLAKLDHVPEEFLHLEQFELAYKLYENDFTGLQRLEKPEEMKHRTMQELLRKKCLTWENISSLMNTSLCKRTPEGWICNQQPIGTNHEFAEIKGLRVHLNPSAYSFLGPQITVELLVIKSNGSNGLVSLSDMETFLTIDASELMPLYFSLDPPSRDEKFHPFQGLRFHPKGLKNTEVLETMLDADYLMKFFSVGSEVSANPPFNQRPCADGLLSRLPPHLKEALKSVPEYGNAKSSLYRFWIEAEEMKYDIEQSGNIITVKCGSPKMIIKKHRMYQDPDGQMRDTEDDDDPDSAESHFAAAMTENYDEIGQYFPAYPRLKELCKFQLLTNFVKNNVSAMSTTAKIEVTDIEANAKLNVTAKIADKPNLPCWWVPASVSRKSCQSYCYGGVNLAPKYVKSSLPALPRNTVPVLLPKAVSRTNKKANEDSDSSSTSDSSSSRYFAPKHHSATPRKRQSQDSRSSIKPQHYTGGAQPTYMPQQPPSIKRSSLPKPNMRPGDSTPQYYGTSTPKGSLTKESQYVSTRPERSAPRTGTQKRPSTSSTVTPVNQRGATRQSSGRKSAPTSIPSDSFKATKSVIPISKSMVPTLRVITTPAGCRELPIATDLLSSPSDHCSSIPQVFRILSHASWTALSSIHFNGFPTSDVSSKSKGAVIGYGGSVGGGGGESSGGSSGDGGGDGSGGGNRPGILLTAVAAVACALYFAVEKFRASDFRNSYAARVYRKNNNVTDRNQHAAHILSLEVALFVVNEGVLSGIITMSAENIHKYLKKALNVQENFQTVSREVNLIHHRRYDGAIIGGYLSDEHLQGSTRGKEIIKFFKEHLIRLVPFELTVSFLKVFRSCGLITEAKAEHIETMAKDCAPKIHEAKADHVQQMARERETKI